MSSLWTPDGERPVPPKPAADPIPPHSADPRQPADPGSAGHGSASEGDAGSKATTSQIGAESLRAAASQLGIDLDSLSPEDIEELQAEMAEAMRVRAAVAETPAADMIANHLMRLFDVTMIYLEANPPRFGDATVVIESFRAALEGAGHLLGEHAGLLHEALGQMQMAFVQVKNNT